MRMPSETTASVASPTDEQQHGAVAAASPVSGSGRRPPKVENEQAGSVILHSVSSARSSRPSHLVYECFCDLPVSKRTIAIATPRPSCSPVSGACFTTDRIRRSGRRNDAFSPVGGLPSERRRPASSASSRAIRAELGAWDGASGRGIGAAVRGHDGEGFTVSRQPSIDRTARRPRGHSEPGRVSNAHDTYGRSPARTRHLVPLGRGRACVLRWTRREWRRARLRI